MFNVVLVGKKEQVLAHFKDRMRQLKEQAEDSHEALLQTVQGLLEHMPAKSPIHGGVLVRCEGDVRPETARVSITVESVALIGG